MVCSFSAAILWRMKIVKNVTHKCNAACSRGFKHALLATPLCVREHFCWRISLVPAARVRVIRAGDLSYTRHRWELLRCQSVAVSLCARRSFARAETYSSGCERRTEQNWSTTTLSRLSGTDGGGGRGCILHRLLFARGAAWQSKETKDLK